MERSSFRQVVCVAVMATALVVMAAGCARPVRGTVILHHDNARVVVIQKGHRHSARCGHYRHKNKWYMLDGHVHGKRCGHHKVHGVWVTK